MNTDMVESHKRVVVDTNVLISDILFGGKPRIITTLILEKKIIAFISADILAELLRVLKQKFQLSTQELLFIESKIKDNFKMVYPKIKLNILKKDEPDNRILEAAVGGKCNYIITGDKELLKLKKFKKIQIVTPEVFLSLLRT